MTKKLTHLSKDAKVAQLAKASRAANYKVFEWNPELTGKIGNTTSFPDTNLEGSKPLPGETTVSDGALRLQSKHGRSTGGPQHGSSRVSHHVFRQVFAPDVDSRCNNTLRETQN